MDLFATPLPRPCGLRSSVDPAGAGGAPALLEAALTGDRDALERLLAPHEAPLYRLCRGMLDDPDDAEDAVQETLLRALRALPRFRGEATSWTWLYRIGVNVCLEWKRARRPVEPERILTGTAAPGPSPEGAALERVAAAEALRAVPARQRAVLLLKELEGWSVAEIAAALSCSERRVYYELRLAHEGVAEWVRRSEAEGETRR